MKQAESVVRVHTHTDYIKNKIAVYQFSRIAKKIKKYTLTHTLIFSLKKKRGVKV